MLLSLFVALVLLLHYLCRRVAQRRHRRSSAAATGGFISGAAFRPLREAYAASCRSYESGCCGGGGGGGGSSLAVFHRGQLVADLWSGVADPYSSAPDKRAWTRWTEANAHSCANCLSAICLARLAAEGRLDYEQPVARYWPEFAANGKSDITVAQLMSQTAGLAGLDEPIDARQLAAGQSQSGVNRVLANQAPLWPPEEAQVRQFHYWTWGLYADALLQRVDPKGRRLADYFREEIAEPHGLSVRIGACPQQPAPRHQLARPVPNWCLLWRCLTRPEYWPSLRRLLRSLLSLLRPRSLHRLATNACRGALVSSDLPAVAGGATGTAEAFARLLALLAAGKIVVGAGAAELVRRLAEPLADLPEANPHCGCRLAIGLGTCPMQAPLPAAAAAASPSSPWLLGCVGYGGQFAYCDLDRQLSVAFLTNSLSPMSWGEDPRCLELLEAAIRCCDRADRQN